MLKFRKLHLTIQIVKNTYRMYLTPVFILKVEILEEINLKGFILQLLLNIKYIYRQLWTPRWSVVSECIEI